MELCLYNTVLTGMSYNGKEFTYVNQLASSGDDLSKREEWFECACCPPNVTRLFGSIGGYVWSYDIEDDQKSATVAVHLYTAATLSFSVAGTEVQIKQTTEWPLDGDVEFSITTSASLNIKLALRIPGWAEVFEVGNINQKNRPSPPPPCAKKLILGSYRRTLKKLTGARDMFTCQMTMLWRTHHLPYQFHSSPGRSLHTRTQTSPSSPWPEVPSYTAWRTSITPG